MIDLVARAEGTVRDVSPVFSPDGKWVVFASSRDRSFDETSLWLVAATPGATPVRLTDDDAIDLSPAWMPDGSAVVFASSRGDSVDLWRLEVALGDAPGPRGEPERLTDLVGEELSPSVAADGRIAFTRIEHDGEVARTRIAVRDPDGEVRNLTAGPADTGPSWSPDGERVVFTAPHLRAGDPPAVDGDLFVVRGDDPPSLLVDLPGTDETGPVWSKDGGWLFATSIFRSARTGDPLFASIVYLEPSAATPTVRMLRDASGAVIRLAVAVAPVELDGKALRAGPSYREELAAILRRAVEKND
jgi:Tol biopolymer transport system component